MKKINNYRRGEFADWKYLVILDACRVDVFEECIDELGFEGELQAVSTDVDRTPFWYRRFWKQTAPSGVCLISANPNPWDTGSWWAHRSFKEAIWADLAGSYVKRDPILPMILKHYASHPDCNIFDPRIALSIFGVSQRIDDRYLIHLMPPHLPFQGPEGKQLFRDLRLEAKESPDIYKAMTDYGRAGNWDHLRFCYKESVIDALRALYDYRRLFTSGRTVISSDHSELIGEPGFGEQGFYRHSRAERGTKLFEILSTVPWFVWSVPQEEEEDRD